MFKGDSLGHLKVRGILEMNGFDWEEEFIFEDLKASSGWPLRFDFMVFDEEGEIDFAIEFNGIQHYKAVEAFGGEKKFKRQKHNDAMKRTYCQKHGIPLVEIHYQEMDELNIAMIMERAGL